APGLSGGLVNAVTAAGEHLATKFSGKDEYPDYQLVIGILPQELIDEYVVYYDKDTSRFAVQGNLNEHMGQRCEGTLTLTSELKLSDVKLKNAILEEAQNLMFIDNWD